MSHPRPLTSLVLLGLLLGSCSLFLRYDPSAQPCDDEGRCLVGFACVDGFCVAAAEADGGETTPPPDGGEDAGGGCTTPACAAVTLTRTKPNVMLLVERSALMDLPVVTPLPAACRLSDGGTCGATKATLCNVATCPTRWSEGQLGLRAFLQSSSGATARFGLALFPTDTGCAAPTQPLLEVSASLDQDAELRQRANEIAALLATLASNQTDGGTRGGTPTAATLRWAGQHPRLREAKRDDFALLVSGALPHCNPQNPNTCANAPACRCVTNCGSAGSCTTGCLDKDALVAAATANLAAGVRTIAVVVGPEGTSTAGQEVFDAVAAAGGFVATCPGGTNAECGAGATCNASSTVCSPRHFRASSDTDLETVLNAIAARLTAEARCSFWLENPATSAAKVHVYVNFQEVLADPTTWSYLGGKVVFAGNYCQAIASGSPPTVEVRVEP